VIPAHPRINPIGGNIMAKNTNKPAPETKRFNAYTVRDFERNGATEHDWMRIGVAFPNDDSCSACSRCKRRTAPADST
jgi:hypothetical protein